MGKKLKFPSPWPWNAYCHQPRTLSFRTPNQYQSTFKTLNSAYNLECIERNESLWFSNSSGSFSTTTVSDESGGGGGGGPDCIESMIRGLRSSERLFFEPGETNSIMGEAKADGLLFKESVVLSMESQDPYLDFKKSMEEMVDAHGLKDSWEGLEELLCCYLRVNEKSNHGCIVSAFVDLLVGFAVSLTNNNDSSSSPSPSSSANCFCNISCSPPSPLSFYTSTATTTTISDDCSSSAPCVSSMEADQEEEIHSISSSLSSLQLTEK